MGILADVLWYEIKNHAKNIGLGEFVAMPNHVHGILILNNPNTNNLINRRDKACLVSTINNDINTNKPNTRSIGRDRFQNQGKIPFHLLLGDTNRR